MARSFRASTTGIELVKQAFHRKGWTQDYLAGRAGCSRQTVSHFFAGRLIDKEIFQNLCSEFGLKWEEIVDWELEELSIKNRETCNTMDISTTPVDKTEDQNKSEARVAYAIAGTVAKVDLPMLKAIVALLQKKTGDFSIETVDLEEGSVRLILEGSQAGLEQIQTLFNSGQLTEVLGIPVLDAQFLTAKDSEQEKKRLVFIIDASISPEDLQAVKAALTKASDNNTDEKSRLVHKIRSQIAWGRDLSGADLSDANLSDADLSSSYLNDANLSGSYLRDANLSGSYLRDVNLSGSYLRDANLSGADLSGANLISANLISAKLLRAKLLRAKMRDADLRDADLTGAQLVGANLSGANLIGANLSGANLIDANLSGANLSDAKVKNARFKINLGITEQMKQDLIQRGAIFNDSPGDRSKSLVPH